MTSLLLASASPARLATLRGAGISPLVQVSDVDEDALLAQALSTNPDLSYAQQVLVLAQGKARNVAQNLAGATAPDLVVGADSMLEFEGTLVGKPQSEQVAAQRWRAMAGKSATLHTGHWVIAQDGRQVGATSSTIVHFARLTEAEIDAYVATGEPLQVAGGFTIDGLGGAFISRVEGDHHGVVGLSLPLLRELIMELGFTWTSLWTDLVERG